MSRQVTVPAFEVRKNLVSIAVREHTVTLVKLSPSHPYYGVYLHPSSYAMVQPTYIGTIERQGTGWDADYTFGMGETQEFHGDYYPVRTGKHTQRFALSFLIACAAGFGNASNDIRYDDENGRTSA
jgi:hypothetical protein